MIRKLILGKLVLGLTIVAITGAGVAVAQQPGIKRTPLQKVEFPDGYDTVTAIAEIPTGGASGRHTHPGAETGYVLEGELELGDRRQAAAQGEGRRILSNSARRRA
jgi:quercetin dioxygenase-like cupin family protein